MSPPLIKDENSLRELFCAILKVALNLIRQLVRAIFYLHPLAMLRYCYHVSRWVGDNFALFRLILLVSLVNNLQNCFTFMFHMNDGWVVTDWSVIFQKSINYFFDLLFTLA